MKIIIRYALREVLAPFLLALVAFTSLLVVDKVFDLTKYFVEKGISLWYMLELLFYFSPAVIVLTVPMAYLVGIVTGFGRLAADNEITAMKTAGVGIHKLIVPLLIISLALSIFMVFFMDFALPGGNKAYNRLSSDIQRKNPALVLEPGIIMEEMSSDNKKWYFDSIDAETGRMKGIRIWERVTTTPKLITAKEGELNSFGKWTSLKLYDGKMHQADRKDPLKGYVVGSFAENELVLDISSSVERETRASNIRSRNMSIKEIRAKLKEYEEKLVSPRISKEAKKSIEEHLIPEYRVEYYKKISIPFACLVFGLVGVPLGLMVRRGGRMVGLGVGVGMITLYYAVLTAGEKIAKVGAYPAFLGAWTPNILTAVIGIILIIRTVRETPIRSSRFINKLFPSERRYGANSEERK